MSYIAGMKHCEVCDRKCRKPRGGRHRSRHICKSCAIEEGKRDYPVETSRTDLLNFTMPGSYGSNTR